MIKCHLLPATILLNARDAYPLPLLGDGTLVRLCGLHGRLLFEFLLVDFLLSVHSLVGFTAHLFFLNGPSNFPLHTFWVDGSFRGSLCNPQPGSYCRVMEVLLV